MHLLHLANSKLTFVLCSCTIAVVQNALMRVFLCLRTSRTSADHSLLTYVTHISLTLFFMAPVIETSSKATFSETLTWLSRFLLLIGFVTLRFKFELITKFSF